MALPPVVLLAWAWRGGAVNRVGKLTRVVADCPDPSPLRAGLTIPFLIALPGFEAREIDPVTEGKECGAD